VPGVVCKKQGVTGFHRKDLFLGEIDLVFGNAMAFERLTAPGSAVRRVVIVLLVFD
jgi:hypothetical protein